MRLMIDNTGIQSTGLALDRSSRGLSDVDEMLQLATLLVFAEKITAGGYEIPEVASRTAEVRQRLISLGLNAKVLQPSYMTRVNFASVCMIAAEQCAEDIFLFRVGSAPDGRLYPAALQSSRVDARLPLFSRLLYEKLTEQELRNIAEESLDAKKAGAIAYMLASNSKLRANASKVIDNQPLSIDIVNQLDAFCRFYLNGVLASQQRALYTPAVSRARLLRRDNDLVISALTDSLDQVVDKFRSVPLGVPVVTAYLLRRSQGEPQALIQEAIALREQASTLRNWLDQLAQRAASGDYEHQFDTQGEVQESAAVLQQAMGFRPAPRFRDALDVLFVLGVPTVRLSGAKLLEWVEYRWKKRKLNLLTHISKSVAYGDDSQWYYQKLAQKCLPSGAPR
jgi:hypothetical protein